MKQKIYENENRQDGVEGYIQYGRCLSCGCELPPGIAEGYCYECDEE